VFIKLIPIRICHKPEPLLQYTSEIRLADWIGLDWIFYYGVDTETTALNIFTNLPLTPSDFGVYVPPGQERL